MQEPEKTVRAVPFVTEKRRQNQTNKPKRYSINRHLKSKKKMSETFATNYLYFSGLKIYCTQNSDIQKNIEDEFSKKQYLMKSNKTQNATSQAAMVVIDHYTGQVMGCARWIRQ